MSVKRASLEKTLEFANKVREAGGGNPLSALLPAIPEDPTQCLIAKNLNFNCCVDTFQTDVGYGKYRPWVMRFESKELRDKIAKKLGLAKRNIDPTDIDHRFSPGPEHLYAVILPTEIGQVAADFDEVLTDVVYAHDRDDDYVPYIRPEYADLAAYIDASQEEVYEIATIVDGRVVV